jgi:hypothetical protein
MDKAISWDEPWRGCMKVEVTVMKHFTKVPHPETQKEK